MTRWPTRLEIHVWATPSAPVAIEMPIMPTTSQVRSDMSRCGIAVSSTCRSRNGETMPRPAETRIRARTALSRPRYGRNRRAIRRISVLWSPSINLPIISGPSTGPTPPRARSARRRELALGDERVAQAALQRARRVAQLAHGLGVARPVRHAVRRGDELAEVGREPERGTHDGTEGPRDAQHGHRHVRPRRVAVHDAG